MPKQKRGVNNKTILAVVTIITVIAVVFLLNKIGITGAASLDEYRREYKIDFKSGDERYTTERMFQYLPPLPEGFWKVRILVLSNILKDFQSFGPEYWMQPEWEPSFLETCLPRLQKADFPKDMHAVGGYSIFPTRQGWVVDPGDKIVAMTVMKSACFVPLYQGLGVKVDYPESARFMNDLDVWYSDPHKARQYFTVEYTPKEFLLGPMFPIINPDYAQRIDVNITVSPDTPPGRYIVALNPTGTSYEFSQAMYRKYLNRYSDTGARFQVGAYTLFIEVRPTV